MVAGQGSQPAHSNFGGAASAGGGAAPRNHPLVRHGVAYPQPTENWMLSPETVWFARTMR
jgi:hypothetical protein